MKQLLLIASILVFCSCNVSQRIQEDKLYITKQYVGEFVEYIYRHPQKFVEPHICYIVTSMDTIVVYGKKVSYQPGEWLYVRRVHSPIPGNMCAYIQYQVESVNTGHYYKLFK